MSLQLTIEKLVGRHNYDDWAMMVQAYLEAEDLWSVVAKGPERTEESLRKDKRAKFIILCLLERKPDRFLMLSIHTAKDLWEYLQR